MSRQILTGLPIFMFVLMNFLAPEYMVDLYGSWLGRALLAVTAVNIVIGSWVMAKLSVLRY
jgi:Flp pilus assembly protein TadB